MSEALDKLITQIKVSVTNPEIAKKFIELAREVALEAWKGGVQHGYMKVIQDHRAGFIDIPSAPHHKLDDAIAQASQNRLAPSEYFKAKQ